jgi:hypothetical protein
VVLVNPTLIVVVILLSVLLRAKELMGVGMMLLPVQAT